MKQRGKKIRMHGYGDKHQFGKKVPPGSPSRTVLAKRRTKKKA